MDLFPVVERHSQLFCFPAARCWTRLWAWFRGRGLHYARDLWMLTKLRWWLHRLLDPRNQWQSIRPRGNLTLSHIWMQCWDRYVEPVPYCPVVYRGRVGLRAMKVHMQRTKKKKLNHGGIECSNKLSVVTGWRGLFIRLHELKMLVYSLGDHMISDYTFHLVQPLSK